MLSMEVCEEGGENSNVKCQLRDVWKKNFSHIFVV
jgi:hypothetical protein